MNEFLSGSAVWGAVLTIEAFGLGTVINRRIGKAWCNPLLLGSIFVIVLLRACLPRSDAVPSLGSLAPI